jgi:hypothetical protein
MKNSLARTSTAIAVPANPGFDFTGFQVFTSVPDHPECGIVALNGMVVIYDTRPRFQEGVIEGAFYVRETQRPQSRLMWETWLNLEWNDRTPRSGPRGPLSIRREVVQAIRWPYPDDWALRLSTGHVDGPFVDWAFDIDLIGKVVGIYLPAASAKEC